MNPFPGLRPFDYADRDWFFGRRTQIYALYRLLDRSRFVAVVGSSGSGKSSLVRAGLLPLLGERWEFVTLRPGAEPLAALAGAIADLADRTQTPDAPGDPSVRRELIEFAIRRSGVGLATALSHVPNLSGKRLLLVVDQFEELFRYDAPESRNSAAQFVQILLDAGRGSDRDVRVLLTMRSDFIGDCARFQNLPEAVSASQFLVPSLTRDQREAVIRRPIDKAGGSIEPDLVERLLNDVSGELDQLPVLQHCLMRLWECSGDAHHLTEELYRSPSIGGAANAISRHADMVLASLTGRTQAIEHVFRALSELDAEGRATRRAIPLSQLVAETGLPERDVRVVLDRFRDDDCSFILPLRSHVAELRGDTRLDIVHEALLRRWERVGAWIYTERDDGEFYHACLTLVKDRHSGESVLLPLGQAERAWQWWTDPPRTRAWGDRYGGHWEAVDRLVRDSVAGHQEAVARERRFTLITRALMTCVVIVGIIAVVTAVSAERRGGATLIAQSEYLAARANDAANQGDAVTGALLALEALPLDIARPDRPFVLAAERSLEGAMARQSELRDIAGSRTVWHVAFSHSGSRLVVASAGGVAVWDFSTGRQLFQLRDAPTNAYDASFSPNDKRIVAAFITGNVACVWDAETGKKLLTLPSGNWVLAANYSPDGRRIVTTGDDGVARVWNASTGKLELVLRPAETSATFSRDGRRILTTSWDGLARIWDATTGKPLLTVRNDNGFKDSAFSHDGKRFATGDLAGAAEIWNAQTGALLATLCCHGARVNSVGFSSDDRRIVIASYDQTASIWDVRTGEELLALRGNTSDVTSAVFSSDGARVVTSSTDGSVRVWNALAAPQLVLSRSDGCCDGAAFSSEDRIVGAESVGFRSDSIREWTARTGALVRTFGFSPQRVAFVTISPNDARIAATIDDGTTRLWNVTTGKQERPLPCGAGAVAYWEGASFSPDGSRVVTTCNGSIARVWDTRSEKTLLTLRDGTAAVTAVAYAPNGKNILAGYADGTARLWDARSGALLRVLRGHSDAISYVTFSPDGSRIATASFDATARVWREDTGTLLAVLVGHTDRVTAVAFSPDGALVATASLDRTVRIWDAATGAELLQLDGGYALNAATFSPDGRSILTINPTGTKLFALPSSTRRVLQYHCQALIDYARETLPRALTDQQRAENFVGARSNDPFLRLFRMGDTCK